MNTRECPHWPLRPTRTAQALADLAEALDGIVFDWSPDKEPALQGVTSALRTYATELARFFNDQEPADERLLERLEEK